METITRNSFLRKTTGLVLGIFTASMADLLIMCSNIANQASKKRVWKPRTKPLTKRHEEYIAYYRARVKKYRNNPLYPNSLAAELRLLETIENVEDLGEFKKILQEDRLDTGLIIALVKDQEAMRYRLYTELNEKTRAKTSQKIINTVETKTSTVDVVQSMNELLQQGNKEISGEQFVNYVYTDFLYLENIEVWEKAEVPEKYRAELNKWAADTKASTKALWIKEIQPSAEKFVPGWKLDYQLLWKERYRRLIPVPDSSLKRRIEEHKKLL